MQMVFDFVGPPFPPPAQAPVPPCRMFRCRRARIAAVSGAEDEVSSAFAPASTALARSGSRACEPPADASRHDPAGRDSALNQEIQRWASLFWLQDERRCGPNHTAKGGPACEQQQVTAVQSVYNRGEKKDRRHSFPFRPVSTLNQYNRAHHQSPWQSRHFHRNFDCRPPARNGKHFCSLVALRLLERAEPPVADIRFDILPPGCRRGIPVIPAGATPCSMTKRRYGLFDDASPGLK